jgi:hypothetical protein
MSLEVEGPAPPGDRPEDAAAGKQLIDASIVSTPRAYCVIMATPYGKERQRVFLSLHSAVQAVERTRKRGLQAELILVKLVPVTGDLDVDGGELP